MPLNTKRALAESLKSLLRARPLSKITIADITDGCGISRMTFYYHFRDIYDLIDWICREEGSRAIAGRTDRETWQEGFCGLCRYVLENRSFFASVYHSISREQIENYLYSVIYDLLYRVVEEQSRGAGLAGRRHEGDAGGSDGKAQPPAGRAVQPRHSQLQPRPGLRLFLQNRPCDKKLVTGAVLSMAAPWGK